MIGKTLLASLLVFQATAGQAAMTHDDQAADSAMPSMDMKETQKPDHAMPGMLGSASMQQEASGTSWQPAVTPMQGIMGMTGGWMTMIHGSANLNYSQQGGPRGADMLYSTNMLMAMASRPLGVGTLGLRGMFSLEPSLGPSGYPLLLQTGESADGKHPLVDRQHPHDLFMELALTYSIPLSDQSAVFAYLGLPGEPALGPPAFMHRFSGADNPAAPLSHHWFDGTHITEGVATLGFMAGDFKADASAFRGREPDQNRWDIEEPRLDSWSGRLSYNPGKKVALQASYGHLTSPEALNPGEDENKFIASAMIAGSREKIDCETTLGWGRTMHADGGSTNAYFVEWALNYDKTHTLFLRAESVEKDELFENGSAMAGKMFTIGQFTQGYIYDFPAMGHFQCGLGASGTVNYVPEALVSSYGHWPLSYLLFLRLKAV